MARLPHHCSLPSTPTRSSAPYSILLLLGWSNRGRPGGVGPSIRYLSMLRSMVLPTKPPHLQGLRVVLMMCLGRSFAPFRFTRPPHHLAVSDCIVDGCVRPVLLRVSLPGSPGVLPLLRSPLRGLFALPLVPLPLLTSLPVVASNISLRALLTLVETSVGRLRVLVELVEGPRPAALEACFLLFHATRLAPSRRDYKYPFRTEPCPPSRLHPRHPRHPTRLACCLRRPLGRRRGADADPSGSSASRPPCS